MRPTTVEYTLMNTSISVVLPTLKRERLLVDTIAALLPLLKEGDEILVIDQSFAHEAIRHGLCQARRDHFADRR